MSMPLVDPTLYAIVDLAPDGAGVRLEPLLAAVAGGVTLVQLRGKGSSPRRLLIEARELVRRLDPLGVPLIVNDRADVARAAGARGVHLGQSDTPASFVRRAWPDGIVGVSVHNAGELAGAVQAGASYVAAGSLFATGTKADATPLTPEMLSALTAGSPLPVIAIGGITVANAGTARALGCAGIAVISGLWSADDPGGRARELRAAFAAPPA